MMTPLKDTPRRMSRPCPSCQIRQVETGKLLCRRCWARVPEPIQAEVYRTWKAFLNGKPDAMSAYETARDAAVDAAQGNPKP